MGALWKGEFGVVATLGFSAMFRGKEFLVAVLQNSEEAVRPNLFLHLTAYADSTQVTLTSTDGGSSTKPSTSGRTKPPPSPSPAPWS